MKYNMKSFRINKAGNRSTVKFFETPDMKPKPIAWFPSWTTITANYQLLCSSPPLPLALKARNTYPSSHFLGHSSSVPSPAPFRANSLHLPVTKTDEAGVSPGPDGTAWALALFIIHARLLPRRSFPSSSLNPPHLPFCSHSVQRIY